MQALYAVVYDLIAQFRVFFFFSTSCPEKGDITRSNMFCNGSTKNYAGSFSTFETYVLSSKAAANPSKTAYPQWSKLSFYPAKHFPGTFPTFVLSRCS